MSPRGVAASVSRPSGLSCSAYATSSSPAVPASAASRPAGPAPASGGGASARSLLSRSVIVELLSQSFQSLVDTSPGGLLGRPHRHGDLRIPGVDDVAERDGRALLVRQPPHRRP